MPVATHGRLVQKRRAAMYLASLVLIAGLATVLVLQMLRTSRAESAAHATAERVSNATLESQNLLQHVVDAESNQRVYLLTGNEAYLEPYQAALADVPQAVDRLKALTASDPDLAGRAATIGQLAGLRLASLERMIEIRRSRGLAAATAAITSNRGQGLMDALRGEVKDLLYHLSQRALAAGEASRAQARLRGVLIATLFGVGGALAGLAARFSVHEARTWRQLAEAEASANAALLKARQEAEASNLAKTRFLSAASHDLRQPLHAIALYVDALRSRVATKEGGEIVERVAVATQGMLRLFGGLLDLSRLESGGFAPNVGIELLQPLMQSAVDEIREQARLAGGEVRLAPTSLAVRTDPEILKSILRNFLSNAVKFGAGEPVLVGARRQGAYVRIEVYDRGPGVAGDKLEAIFDEFTQLDVRESGSRSGFGLGLSIARRLADLAGAALDVRSTPGRGSMFSVTVERVKAMAAPVQETEPVPTLEGLRVMLFDDDDNSRDAMIRVLTDAGAEVVAVHSADEARAVAATTRFDLMVADEKGLSAWRTGSRMPRALLIITGATDPSAIATLERAGARYLLKPATAVQLIQQAASAVAAAQSPPRET